MDAPLDLTQTDPTALIEALLAEAQETIIHRLDRTVAGQRIREIKPADQAAVIMASLKWFETHHGPSDASHYTIYNLISELSPRKLPFTETEVIQLLEWHSWRPGVYMEGHNHIPPIILNYLANHPLSPSLEKAIRNTIHMLEEWQTAQARPTIATLRNLIGDESPTLPLNCADKWAEAIRTDILLLPDKSQRTAWAALLEACAQAPSSAPTRKWLKSARQLLEAVTWPMFKEGVLKWFPIVNQSRDPMPEMLAPYYLWIPNPALLDPEDTNVLKGLIWLCAQSNEAEIVRAIASLAVCAYRKIPQHGSRSSKIGNACVWTLAHLPGSEGIAQLAILKMRIKGHSNQKAIERALAGAAARANLSPEDVEELSAPTYGLESVGQRQMQLGEFRANLTVAGTDEVALQWLRADGKQVKSIPQAIKKEYSEQVQELTRAAKDIRAMLPAQRSRIENLYLQQRKWAFESWRAYYLDHPLVGTLARRLIWKFSQGDRAASGIWHEGQLVDRKGKPIDWLTATTQVELWHPLEVATDVVLAWRTWLVQHQVQQPFKQAHREIYVLTEAERNTQVYSNRFAAHIIRQHQFNSLCAGRGWKNQLRLMVDADHAPPMRRLPRWGLRAEFWVEPVGDTYGSDTNGTGTYLYLATDQVRFYNLEANTNSTHATGGGYYMAVPQDDARHQPLQLDTIPPLVFSEIMRDVDLFVGVASVGNDPNWIDGGTNPNRIEGDNNQLRRDYWTRYAFGDLSETAKTRRETLAALLPSLKIKDRCSLTEKFLIVQGTLRTYKIHLGSGNILMEPNDQYLCIVPAQGAVTGNFSLRIFLPFEDDTVTTIILSKAFLLAEDQKITDPTIVRQIKRA